MSVSPEYMVAVDVYTSLLSVGLATSINPQSWKNTTMYISALQCIYTMYIDVTQCISPNVYWGPIYIVYIHCVTFCGDPYIHCVTPYTLWCMLIFVTQCIYPIYIVAHVYTLCDTHIHCITEIYIVYRHLYTLCCNDNKHIHCVTWGIYIVVHYNKCT